MDTRCYACIEFIDDPNRPDDFAEQIYLGKGKFKCSRCGDELDLSEKTYSVKVCRGIEEGSLYTHILELDDRLGEVPEVEDDIWELFEHLPEGEYECEVYMNWYQVCDDWDCDTELFSHTPV